MAQSPPPVAPASAAGTAPSRAGRAASIPAACGLDLNDLMPPLLRPNTRRIAPGMRIAPGIQWYGGSGILPDTCQRCETWNCEVSFSGQPRRSWRSLPASAGCPRPDRDLLTTAWHKYRRAFERSPSRIHASRRAPNESCGTAPATAKSPPGSNEACRTRAEWSSAQPYQLIPGETARLVGAIRCHSSAELSALSRRIFMRQLACLLMVQRVGSCRRRRPLYSVFLMQRLRSCPMSGSMTRSNSWSVPFTCSRKMRSACTKEWRVG